MPEIPLTMVRWLDHLLPEAHPETGDELHRSRVLAGLLLNGALACASMAVVRYFNDGAATATLVTAAGFMLFIMILAVFRLSGSRRLAGDLTVLLAVLVVFAVGYSDGGINSRVTHWLPALPLIGGFVGGRLRAAATSLLVGGVLAVLYVLADHGYLAGAVVDDATLPRAVAALAATLFTAIASVLYETSRLRAEQERARLDTEKRDWIAVVSHELRTPLTALRGSLGLLSGGTIEPGSSKADRLLRIADQNCHRLVRLVNDVLDFERLEAGRLPLHRNSVALLPLLEEVVATNGDYAADQSVELVLKPVPATIVIDADPDRITQVLHNLVSNAIKHSPRPGTVELEADYNANTVTLYVRDCGPGVPESFQDRIFSKFAQADEVNSRRSGGSGLGLAISKAIVEQHGGTIGYSNRDNGGALFFVKLPAG